jgi:hypothetical protein
MRQIETRLARLEKAAPDDDLFGLKKMTDDELEALCRDFHVWVLSREDCTELHADARAQLEQMDREARKRAEFYSRPDVAAACAKNRAK